MRNAVVAVVVALVSACIDSGGRQWETVRQTAEVSCAELCVWAEACGQLGDFTAETCPAECAAVVCGENDCDATPSGTDEEIDSCMSKMEDHTRCGVLLGISEGCQALMYR